MMKDRVIAGAVAGAAGSIVQLLYGIAVKSMGLTDRSFSDFAKIFMMYENYSGVLAYIIGAIVEIIIGALIGVVFSYLIKITSGKYYYIKGLGLGAVFWLLFGVAGTVFELPLFKEIPPKAALATLGGALLFGLGIAYTFKLLGVRGKTVYN